MSFTVQAAAAAILLLVSVPSAFAQATPAMAEMPAGQPGTQAPKSNGATGPIYRSAFDGYRRYSDQPVESWRRTNDTVGQIGGWKVYAREGQASDASPPAATDATPPAAHTDVKAPAKPAAGGHAGHH